MRKLWALILVIALAVVACSTSPEIIPDTTADSVIMLDIKSQIENNKMVKDDYGWVIWYLPVLFLVVAWGWKEFFGKKKGE
jgi:cytochrome bd-type quinol oxidase subunit 2